MDESTEDQYGVVIIRDILTDIIVYLTFSDKND